jgi:hypothetical protein
MKKVWLTPLLFRQWPVVLEFFSPPSEQKENLTEGNAGLVERVVILISFAQKKIDCP